jgi:hypothetical protein
MRKGLLKSSSFLKNNAVIHVLTVSIHLIYTQIFDALKNRKKIPKQLKLIISGLNVCL